LLPEPPLSPMPWATPRHEKSTFETNNPRNQGKPGSNTGNLTH
jgi:hypothetical protein